jgi:hypothetical protein
MPLQTAPKSVTVFKWIGLRRVRLLRQLLALKLPPISSIGPIAVQRLDGKRRSLILSHRIGLT